ALDREIAGLQLPHPRVIGRIDAQEVAGALGARERLLEAAVVDREAQRPLAEAWVGEDLAAELEVVHEPAEMAVRVFVPDDPGGPAQRLGQRVAPRLDNSSYSQSPIRFIAVAVSTIIAPGTSV